MENGGGRTGGEQGVRCEESAEGDIRPRAGLGGELLGDGREGRCDGAI